MKSHTVFIFSSIFHDTCKTFTDADSDVCMYEA